MFQKGPRGEHFSKSLQASFGEIETAHRQFNQDSHSLSPEESEPLRQLESYAELLMGQLKDRVHHLMHREAFYFDPSVERHRVGTETGFCSALIVPSIISSEGTEGYLLPPLSDLADLHSVQENENPGAAPDSKQKKLLVASNFSEGQIEMLRNPVVIVIRDAARISSVGSFEAPYETELLWSSAAFTEACELYAAKLIKLSGTKTTAALSADEAQVRALKRNTDRYRERHSAPSSRSLFPLGVDALVEVLPGYFSEQLREGILMHLEYLIRCDNSFTDASVLAVTHAPSSILLTVEFHGTTNIEKRASLERDPTSGLAVMRWMDPDFGELSAASFPKRDDN